MTTTYDEPTPPERRFVTAWSAEPTSDRRVKFTIRYGDPTAGWPEPTVVYLPEHLILSIVASLATAGSDLAGYDPEPEPEAGALERIGYLCLQRYPTRICQGCTSACSEPVFAYPESAP